ncbi:hypothetical protein ACFL4L_03635 [bacterium]
MDERFLIHRLRSTSLAGIIGAVALGVWTLYQYYAKDIFRMDLFIILLIMGVVKVTAMLIFRRTN